MKKWYYSMAILKMNEEKAEERSIEGYWWKKYNEEKESRLYGKTLYSDYEKWRS